MNSEDGTSKTDMPQQWGKPSKAGEIIYIKGKQISELFTPKHLKLNVRSHDDLIQHHSLLEIPCSLNINLRQEKRSEIEITCQHVIEFTVKDVENQFITENNNKYLQEIIMNQNKFNTFKNSYIMFLLNYKEHNIYHQEVAGNDEIIK